MKEEINVAVKFIGRLIENNNNPSTSTSTKIVLKKNRIDTEQLEVFKTRLAELLNEKFQNHWFVEKPTRGQGFRCIRVNESDLRDKVIDKAASSCGLRYDQLNLPAELTIWIDPKDVSCRFGEHGGFEQIASFKNGKIEIYIDQINLEEIHKKELEHKEKIMQEAASRKNNVRRGILPNTNNRSQGSSPNSFKSTTNRSYTSGYNTNNSSNNHQPQPQQQQQQQQPHTPPHHHHHHHSGHHHSNGSGHGGGHGGGHHQLHSPSPAAINWYNNVHNAVSNEFPQSTSPPNQYNMHSLAKFSPPKFGYGSSKWTNSNSPGPHPMYNGGSLGSGGSGVWKAVGGSDKYHWFNHNKSIIKA